MRFANDFHSWRRHSRQLLANRLTRDPKIVIHGNSCIILFISNDLTVNYHENRKYSKCHIWKMQFYLRNVFDKQ